MPLDFKIKLAEEIDIMNIFYLSNDPIVRKNSFNQENILLSKHKTWFKNKIKSKDSIFYVLKSLNEDFMGYIRFDRDNLDSNLAYIVTIHLKEEFRGKGIGTKILSDASSMLSNKYKKVLIYAYIKKKNIASIKSFLKAGYKIVCEIFVNGSDCFKLQYNLDNKG